MLYSELLKKKRPCPFCSPGDRIFAAKGGSYLTYSIAPYAKYHLLVVPKRHDASLTELTPKEWRDIHALLTVGAELLRRKGVKDYTVLMRNGSAAGRSVRHPHLHLVPEHRIGDLDRKGTRRRVLTPREIAALTAEMAALLQKR